MQLLRCRQSRSDIEDQVRCSLGLTPCDDNHAGIVSQRLKPVRQVRCAVVDSAILNSAKASEERSTEFCYQLFLAVRLISPVLKVGECGAIQASRVPLLWTIS